MKEKGQGAIEYLLLVGAALMVVAIVIVMLAANTTASNDKLNQERLLAHCNGLIKEFCENPAYSDFTETHEGGDCKFDETTNECIPNCTFQNNECIEPEIPPGPKPPGKLPKLPS